MSWKLFYFFVFIFLISCTSKQSQQKSLFLDGKCYVIDLDDKREESIPLSSIFNHVRTIILENGDDCLIGNINDLQVFDGNIYILDSRKAKSLFVFDMEGKFIQKIGGIGNGPGEYLEPNDFTLDRENRIIYLCDLRNRIHKYQLNGTFINTITINTPNSAKGTPNSKAIFIQYYNGRLYSSQIWWDKSDDNYMLLEIDPSDGKILSSSLPVKYNKGWNELYFSGYSRFFMSRANNPPRYNQMFMDYIVSIGKEITPYIELKSKYLTTESDIEDFRGKDGLPVNTMNVIRSPKIFNVNCFIENDDFIRFRLGMQLSSLFTVVFYKKTGEVKLANYLRNDLIYKQDQKSALGGFVFADAKGAYEILDTQRGMHNYIQSSVMENKVVPDLDKLDQLMKLTAESNPAIFFYEFK